MSTGYNNNRGGYPQRGSSPQRSGSAQRSGSPQRSGSVQRSGSPQRSGSVQRSGSPQRNGSAQRNGNPQRSSGQPEIRAEITGRSNPSASHRKNSKAAKRRKRRKILLIVEFAILAFLVTILIIYLTIYSKTLGAITHTEPQLNTIQNEITEEAEEVLSGYTDIALFGVDNRTNGDYTGGNSDSIMIASINNDTREVRIVSVYRDTCMDVDGAGKYRKCNYAFNHGGPENTINMLNRNLDMDITDYVAVDFKALVDCVDAVGGIELEITDEEAKIMNKEYIGYINDQVGKSSSRVSGGIQTVDGVQALAYCRVRYTAGNDFKRAARQRIVVQKLVEKAKQADLGTVLNLAMQLCPEMSTSLTNDELLELITHVREYAMGPTSGYPFTKRSGNFGKIMGDLVVPCSVESNVKQLYVELFGDTEHECSQTVKDISHSVINFTTWDENDAIEYDPKYEDASLNAPVPDATEAAQ